MTLRVRFVVLESVDRHGSDVDHGAGAVRRADGQSTVKSGTGTALVPKAVSVVLAADVAHQRIAAVRPPEGGSLGVVVGKRLALRCRGPIGLDSEVAIQHVVDFRAVLEKVAVPHRFETDAIAHHQIFRAVNGDPPIVRIDDGGAKDAAAAHAVGDSMEVDRVAPQPPLLAEVSEARVADRTST